MSSSRTAWRAETAPVPYQTALAVMEEKIRAIREENAPDYVWLLEHPPLYTAGTSADEKDLKSPLFPVHQTGRGGQYTYHGPGQRIAYAMIDLQKRAPDLRAYIRDLEQWIIETLSLFDVKGERRENRIGIWIKKPDDTEAKIAAIGVRVRKWVAYHGLSINNTPDLAHYKGIVPCGIAEHGVTSLKDLGVKVSAEELDEALRRAFAQIFEV